MGCKSFRYSKTAHYIFLFLGICIAYFSFGIRYDQSGNFQEPMVRRDSRNLQCYYQFLVRSTLSVEVVEMINDKGLHLLKDFEGFSKEPYKDVAGIWTIGFGSIYGLSGKRVTANHPNITKDQAVNLMERDLKTTESRIASLVKVPLTENQFAALCSFVYNVGSGAFQRSTARMKLNRKDYLGCADEFLRWKYAGGRPIKGLLRRRVAERELFLDEEIT